ncbi:MAG TPA: ribosome biogenesis GTP-binding protein YihA/YsxC [Xanthobacteraceae bacterium]|nr:ribosome biogenesis GTP-binding protein YihA/YsxC [Xanthobacteraceae bacterium]
MPDFTSAEIETGRKLFAANWQFDAAAATIESLPPMHGVEIAFAGRSNVGKSSLVNALVGQNALARTSHTPGRTQELIFFSAGGNLTLVDMPGYGYAQAPKAKVAAWTELIHTFLRGRANLARVYVLIDARHGLKDVDLAIFDMLDEAAVSYAIVMTKADVVKPSALAAGIEKTRAALNNRPAAFPDVLSTSSQSGAGVPDLRAAVARLLKEKGGGSR